MKAVEKIACWFILRAREDGDLTLLKLEKLLYYAEGCSLALENGSLFDEPIVAWEHGPAVEYIYDKYQADPYNLAITCEEGLESLSLPEKVQNILGQVYNIFGAYSSSGLCNKTHRESPWLEATHWGQCLNGEINRNAMRKYFSKHYIAV